MNEIRGLLGHYFETTSIDASQYIQAKFDLIDAGGSAPIRTAARVLSRLRGRVLDGLVTHGFMGVFRASGPRPVEDRQRMLAWKT